MVAKPLPRHQRTVRPGSDIMLTGRVAIVLGADRIIGTACADALAAADARVALVGPRQSPALDRLLNGWTPMQMACWIYDMVQLELADFCLRSIADIWAQPTILVNCLQPHEFDSEQQNSHSLVFAHHFLSHLQESGHAGTLIHVLPSLPTDRCETREARQIRELRALTEGLAAACVRKQIRVNMIQTGPEHRGCAQAEQIGWTVAMLASAAAQSITGTVIRADAGVSLVERQAGGM